MPAPKTGQKMKKLKGAEPKKLVNIDSKGNRIAVNNIPLAVI